MVFLILFLNVKLVVKFAAILLIYLFRFNFKFGFRSQHSRLPLFYPIIILIGLFNWSFKLGFSDVNYNIACITGICFWILCLLAIHQVKLIVENRTVQVIHQTILAFFLLNAVVSIATYVLIAFETGTFNLYLYQGEYQKYFIGTGDYIKGILFDTSTTNAVLNAFGVIYFLSKKNSRMMILCMGILLLTGSNITNLLLCVSLLFIFIFQSDRDTKSLIAICFLLLVIFLTKVSPQNNEYVTNLFEENFRTQNKHPIQSSTLPVWLRPDSSLTPDERKQKIAVLYLDSLSALKKPTTKNVAYHDRPIIPVPDINTKPYQHKSFVTPVENNMRKFIKEHSDELLFSSGQINPPKLPGKILAWQQTIDYFKQNPFEIITGTGIGNFSSKLAFKATGLNISGGYPRSFIYRNEAFVKNHLDLYLYFFTQDDGSHSIINNPNSVYDQLISEYGLIGLLAFFIFYIGYFIRYKKQLTYGIPLLLLLSGLFFVDYWFEQLSVVVFFELLMFLNIKKIETA
ncbi:MAG: hypothetical protein ABI297_05255 [Ginsengibacter sp.]